HTPVDEPVDEAVEDEPEDDDVIYTEPEVDDSEESDDALSGHVIVVDAQALTVIQALPGATVSIGQGKSRTHVFTEAIDKLVETGASVVVTANGGTEDIIAEATDAPVKFSEIEFEDRKSTRLNSSHVSISYAVFCLKKKIIISLRTPTV